MDSNLTNYDQNFLVECGIIIGALDKETEKYENKLIDIFQSGETNIITAIKKALDAATRDIDAIKKARQFRRSSAGRDKIRDLLNKIKYNEDLISRIEKALKRGLSSYGRPYAETTLKQMESGLHGHRKDLEKYNHELADYTEEEIREAREREQEDKEKTERESRIEYIKGKDKEHVLWNIEYHGEYLAGLTKKLRGGVKTRGKYKGQPYSKQERNSLKDQVAHHKEYLDLYNERLQELQEYNN